MNTDGLGFFEIGVSNAIGLSRVHREFCLLMRRVDVPAFAGR
jgi:hypothetical protein